LAMAFVLLGKYLYTLVIPHPLVSEIGYPQMTTTNWGNWRAIVAVLLFVGMGSFALWHARRKSFIAFGILFFLITFSIYSNVLILIGSSYGERFLYVASLGYCIALVALLQQAFPGAQPEERPQNLQVLFQQNTLFVGLVSMIVLAYSAKTITRNGDWYDSYALYSADIIKVPNSAKLNYHLGLEEVKQGLELTNDEQQKRDWLDKGLVHFQKAIELYPPYGDAHAQVGLSLFRRGYGDEALKSYQTALQYIPNDAKVYSNMGIIYFQKGNLQKAEEVYSKAVQLDPRYVDARRNLGSVYAQTKRFDQAIAQFKAAITYEPDNAILYFYTGSAYRDKGSPQEGQPYFEQAYRLDPSLRK
ncbi:MAG: tetratricopeptide repeat protein, partial [Bacteroidota bacterium]